MKRFGLAFAVVVAAGLAVSAADRRGRVHDARLLSPGKLERISGHVRGTMEKHGIPGLSVAVIVKRKLAWADGFGRADVENSVPATAVTSYRWASVSKLITATAAMQLVGRGRLDLDAPVQKYVADFPEKKGKITVRHLLCHQSGIRHYKKSREAMNSTRRFGSLQEGLSFFKDDPLLFKPGTRYRYSTFGYSLLGRVVERVSEQTFMEYVRANIFEPARMATARDDSVHDLIPHRAQGYTRTREGGLRNSNLADTSYKIPGGGLCGTVVDLSGFVIATLEGKLLKKSTLERMWVPQKTADGKVTRHGLGWMVREMEGREVVGHGGAQQRVSAWLVVIPEEDFGVVLLCNLERAGSRLRELSAEIMKVLLDEK